MRRRKWIWKQEIHRRNLEKSSCRSGYSLRGSEPVFTFCGLNFQKRKNQKSDFGFWFFS
jgi:hypothetical protein